MTAKQFTKKSQSIRMEINLLENIHDPDILNIPYWQRIQDAIDAQTKPGSSRIAELRNISQSHQNTRDRITFAEIPHSQPGSDLHQSYNS